MTTNTPLLIGRTEWASINGLPAFEATVQQLISDKFALMLCGFNAQYFTRRGKQWLRFTTTGVSNGQDHICEAKVIKHITERGLTFPVVEVTLKVGNFTWKKVTAVIMDLRGESYHIGINFNELEKLHGKRKTFLSYESCLHGGQQYRRRQAPSQKYKSLKGKSSTSFSPFKRL